jgi:hypothetical protein
MQDDAAALVAGTPIFERGEHTGAMPGRLVYRRNKVARSQVSLLPLWVGLGQPSGPNLIWKILGTPK